MIKVAIVDDEADGRELLAILLKDYFPTRVEVVGKAKSAVSGIQLIQETEPDLVLLDIQMPGGTGFDLLAAFPERSFEVILTTAHSKYAVQAIRSRASDYLIKPIDIDDLEIAINRIENLINRSKENKVQESRNIIVPLSDGLLFLDPKEIVRLEANRSYCYFYLVSGEKLLVSRSLKHFEPLLLIQGFFRCHKSHLINLQQVRKFIRKEGAQVELTNSHIIDVARDCKQELIAVLKQL